MSRQALSPLLDLLQEEIEQMKARAKAQIAALEAKVRHLEQKNETLRDQLRARLERAP